MFNCRTQLDLKPLASKPLCTLWDGDSTLTILNADLSDLRAFDLKE